VGRGIVISAISYLASRRCHTFCSKEKRELELRGFLKHGVVIFICTFTLLHFYGLAFALGFLFLVAIFHIGFDVLKVGVEKNINIKSPWFNVVIFIFDQIIHLCVLFYLANIFIIDIEIDVINFYYSVLSLMGISYQSLRFLMSIFPLNKCLIITISYICILFGGAILTRMVIDNIFPQKGLPMKSGCIIIKPSSNQVGWYIGILLLSMYFYYL